MVCSVVVVAMVSGCAKSNPLVGKWQNTQTVMGMTITMTREFRADGTEIMTSPIPGTGDSQMKYTVDGNTITEQVTSMTIGGQTIQAPPPSAGSKAGMQETFAINGDTLTLTNTANGGTGPQTYTRVAQ